MNYDGTELTFSDVLHIASDGDKETIAEELYLPYRYSFIKNHRYRYEAKYFKDRYSIGIVILEILVGSELLFAANTEELVEKLLDDCTPYFDSDVTTLLRILILNEANIDIGIYVDGTIRKVSSKLESSILSVEKAMKTDYFLP